MLTVPGLLIALSAPVALAIAGGVLSARFHRRAERQRTAARERRRAAYSARAERTIHDSFGRVRTAHFVSELLAEAAPDGRTLHRQKGEDR